ncbi:porin family protein [Xanthobacteraceae bacterium Astr-EGSB]|uniref:outer membrane protein n=1 Tax=Astrobacterium formosum TaxID=3069710 RepID=UPI0027B34AC5|nr:porin family protein [Xanthobacteraceae bacterium Astr-EGSB]
MGTAKSVLLAGAMTLLAYPAANAADLPPIMPVKAPAVYDYSGWYLRGDIGMTNQRVGSLHVAQYDVVTSQFDHRDNTFDSAPLFGVGVGYQLNSWLRFDVTGEYRGKSSFRGGDTYTYADGANTGSGFNNFTAEKSEWTVLANAYIDLGTWYGITPFIGAGVGASRNTIHNFKDVGYNNDNLNGTNTSSAYGADASKWSLAWAAHAGLAYQVTPGLTMELAYRYIDLGKAETGDIIGFDGSNATYNPVEFRDITSHDVKFGLRWMLAPEYSPLMRKG